MVKYLNATMFFNGLDNPRFHRNFPHKLMTSFANDSPHKIDKGREFCDMMIINNPGTHREGDKFKNALLSMTPTTDTYSADL